MQQKETTTEIHTFLKCREKVLAWCPPSVEISAMQSLYLKVREHLRSDNIKILSIRVPGHILLYFPLKALQGKYAYEHSTICLPEHDCTMPVSDDIPKWMGAAPQDITSK